MNVGDYVRTKWGEIARIEKNAGKNNFGNLYQLDIKGENNLYCEGNIVKSSPQIIDLIEVGDYVNGSWVNEIKNGKPYHEDYNDPYYSYYFENDDIKTIITHEQMESMKYRVEE